MKSKLVLWIALSVVLVAGSASGSVLTVHSVDGLVTGDSLGLNIPITFYMQATNTEGIAIEGLFNGFRVYSALDANWTGLTADTLGTLTGAQFDLIYSILYFGVTGNGSDSVQFGGSRLMSTGMPAGFDDTAWSITIGPIADTSDGGKTICIDSSYGPPTGIWSWAPGSIFPDWTGPHCWPIEDPLGVFTALGASVSLVEFTVNGSQPEDQVFTILISDGSTDKTVEVTGALAIKAGGDLTFTPSSGTHGTEITVSLDASGLGIGDYDGTITLSCTETSNTKFEMDVEVAVSNPVSVRNLTDNDALPTTYSLSQNYPNPFNPTTQIAFDLPTKSQVSLTVYNVLGQRVATLINEKLAAGKYSADWNGRSSSGNDVASGIYFYRLHTEQFTETKKMVLLK